MISVAVSATTNRSRNCDSSCGTAVETLQAVIPIDLEYAALSLAVSKSLEMAKDFIGYQALTDAALRSVVRDALRRIEKSGLIGSHHFYLTFKTHAEGVD